MIQQGMMWLDDTVGRSTADKIARAVVRYAQKFGHEANVCYVHPDMIAGYVARVGIQVLPAKHVMPNYFWLGVEVAK